MIRLFDRGSHNFNVVLGDANLNIDLPFGVQNHEISEVIVHENYRPEDQYHHEDIGNLDRIKITNFHIVDVKHPLCHAMI